MFGRKRIAELEKTNADQRQEIIRLQLADSKFVNESRALTNQIEYLVRTIRNMDEQIFKMSQCTDWNQMRPNFANLSEGMTVRKRQESDRIGEILQPELMKTYNNQTNQKRLK